MPDFTPPPLTSYQGPSSAALAPSGDFTPPPLSSWQGPGRGGHAAATPTERQQPDDETQHGFWRSLYDTGIKPIYDAVADAHDRGDLGAHAANEILQSLTDQVGKFASSGGDLKELPVIGPVSKKITAQVEAGNYKGALGTLAGFGGALAAPEALGSAADAITGAKVTVLPGLTNPNPAVADAVDFGLKRSIPVDAGTATGNVAVKGIQHLADRSLGGALANAGAGQDAADALTATGRDLAAQAHPAAVTPYQAGASLQKGVESSRAASAAKANAAYQKLEAIENDPANIKNVQVGMKQNMSLDPTQPNMVPDMQDVATPVDMRAVKTALRPIEQQLSQRMTPAQQATNPSLTAIRNILGRPDAIPASVADKDLSYLRGITRSDASSDQVKYFAGQAIDALDQQVKGAVTQAGPDALKALQEGRAATVDKYGAQDVLDQMRDEPVQVFDQALWKNDAGIDHLRAIQKLAPAQMPQIGRAFIDDLINKATAEGDFQNPGRLASRWQSLGPQTKQLIFNDPQLVGDLDKFFLLAKKMGENPNPSGTAHVASLGAQGIGLVTAPHITIPLEIGGAVLSKMLHNPTAVRALTEGLQVPVGGAAAPFVAGKILAQANRIGLANQEQAGKTLDVAMAATLLQQAGGDKVKATQLARQQGYVQ